MDPNATLAIINDPDAEPEDRANAAADLWAWLNDDGFPPDGHLTVRAASEFPGLYDRLRRAQPRAW